MKENTKEKIPQKAIRFCWNCRYYDSILDYCKKINVNTVFYHICNQHKFPFIIEYFNVIVAKEKFEILKYDIKTFKERRMKKDIKKQLTKVKDMLIKENKRLFQVNENFSNYILAKEYNANQSLIKAIDKRRKK